MTKKYIDAEKLKAEIKKRINELEHDKYLSVDIKTARIAELRCIDRLIDSLQQEPPEDIVVIAKTFLDALSKTPYNNKPITDAQIIVRQLLLFFENPKEYNPDAILEQQERQMPNSTQLIAEWEKEKAMLEQKDFRGDAERMAYNAFLDGFVKGLGYESTK